MPESLTQIDNDVRRFWSRTTKAREDAKIFRLAPKATKAIAERRKLALVQPDWSPVARVTDEAVRAERARQVAELNAAALARFRTGIPPVTAAECVQVRAATVRETYQPPAVIG